MKPAFLDSQHTFTRAARVDQSRADYASPITVYPSRRSWLASDIAIAIVFVCVIVAIYFGVL
jgi:hypothetical protein